MKEMIEKLKNSFERLQTLDIQPTVTNQEKLLSTLYDLREVYHELRKREEEENAGTENRAENCSE